METLLVSRSSSSIVPLDFHGLNIYRATRPHVAFGRNEAFTTITTTTTQGNKSSLHKTNAHINPNASFNKPLLTSLADNHLQTSLFTRKPSFSRIHTPPICALQVTEDLTIPEVTSATKVVVAWAAGKPLKMEEIQPWKSGSKFVTLPCSTRILFSGKQRLSSDVPRDLTVETGGTRFAVHKRLEFLGDAVLDFLITRHLYEAHPDLPPGILTDLRSAAVNNEYFAYVAVKHCLQQYLRHGSGLLLEQITRFARAVQQCKEAKGYPLSLQGGVIAPKALGDLVESIAGAILVDSRFNVEKVWEVMKPLLSPIVTPETLNLNPIREAFEICHLKGYPMEWKKSMQQGKLSAVTVEVVLEDSTIVGKGCSTSKKSAKEEAAQQILMQMKQRGIHHPRCSNLPIIEHCHTDIGGTTEQNLEEIISPRGNATMYYKKSQTSESLKLARKKTRVIDTQISFLTSQDPTGDEKEQGIRNHLCQNLNNMQALDSDVRRTRKQSAKEAVSPAKIVDMWKIKIKPSQTREFPGNKAKIITTPMNSKSSQDPFHDKQEDTVSHDVIDFYEKVCIALCMQKGGPRTNLYNLCKNMKWCKPEFQLVDEGFPHTARFMFRVVVYIPERGGLSIRGETRSDKKSAMDSAALSMLLELKKQGFCSLKH